MSSWIVPALRVAGALQLVVAASNAHVVRVLDYRASLAGATRIVRDVFWGTYSWVLVTVIAFGAADLAFPRDLAGATSLGRAVSATLAALWGWRLCLQLFKYDPELRRRHRVADVAFSLFFFYVAVVHAVAALAAPLAVGSAP